MAFSTLRFFSYVYKNDNKSFFKVIGSTNNLYNIRNAEYRASSYLVEEDIAYSANNLGQAAPNTPWVEGVDGSGIGEKLFLKWQTWNEKDGSLGGIGCLIICNGYISYSKPYLYEKNNRVKGIRILGSEGIEVLRTELDDTPNPQLVFLPKVLEIMEIEVLSVYKGTEWDDTCLHSIEGLEMQQSKKLRDIIAEVKDK